MPVPGTLYSEALGLAWHGITRGARPHLLTCLWLEKTKTERYGPVGSAWIELGEYMDLVIFVPRVFPPCESAADAAVS